MITPDPFWYPHLALSPSSQRSPFACKSHLWHALEIPRPVKSRQGREAGKADGGVCVCVCVCVCS